MKIEILDLGINNLKSLTTGLQALGDVDLSVIDNASSSNNPDLLVLPGVGAFGEAMRRIQDRAFDYLIQRHIENGHKIFGICLGMQLLFEESEETPNCLGLGIFRGKVQRLNSHARVPNIGWLDAKYLPNPNWETKLNKFQYYFVHSYTAVPVNSSEVLATSIHGRDEFVAAVISEQALGVQFHPEKSSAAGEELLIAVLAWAGYVKS
jgi:glutamine amidotransferase